MVITNNILIKGSVYLHVKGTLFEGYEMRKYWIKIHEKCIQSVPYRAYAYMVLFEFVFKKEVLS